MSVINATVDRFVPLVSVRNKPPRYPKYIRRLLLRKRRARRPSSLSTRETRNRYRLLSHLCDSAIRHYHDRAERDILNSGDISKFYRYVRGKKCSRGSVPPIRRFDGTLAISDTDKAQVFNNFFASVFTVDDQLSPVLPARTNAALSSTEFPLLSVYNKLKSVRKSTSCGPDGVPNILLANLALPLSEPLAFLYEFSFVTQTLPDLWLCADVVPVFKKGSTSVSANYRPISLTCTTCRVMESIVKDRVVLYLRENHLLSDYQHGFMARRSTTTQLLECFDTWTSWLRDKLGGHVIYIDFAKAFDTVCHNKLLTKLRSYGISGSLYSWIEAYLSNRRQRVRVGNDFSLWSRVTSGVPQGSVLGPLLFILFINDLADIFPPEVSLRLFADDVKLYAPCRYSALLQQTLESLVAWSSKWQLRIAIQKCSALQIGNCLCASQGFSLRGSPLPTVSECRDLGVVVSSSLKFSSHCHHIAGKASRALGVLFRCFRSTDIDAHVRAYVSFVRPILEYCSQVWNPFLARDVSVVEKVQQMFTRRLFLKCRLPYVDYDARLNHLKLQRLSTRRTQADLSYCHQTYHGTNNSVVVWSARNGTRVLLDNCRVDARRNFFSNRVATVWNKLSHTTINLSQSAFKTKVRLLI